MATYTKNNHLKKPEQGELILAKDMQDNLDTIDDALNTKANTSNLAKVASTGSYADLTGKPDDELLERDAHLHRDITHVAFDLKIKGLIDDSEYDCLSVDTIDAATDVNLTHGKFSDGFVYI